jgi:putative transposase
VESELHAYLAGIAHNLDSPCVVVNGTSDHVHILVSQSKNLALDKLVEGVKKGLSNGSRPRAPRCAASMGKEGYAAFPVSQSKTLAVEGYTARQKEQHRMSSFQKEVIQFLRRHGVKYDEPYIWT